MLATQSALQLCSTYSWNRMIACRQIIWGGSPTCPTNWPQTVPRRIETTLGGGTDLPNPTVTTRSYRNGEHGSKRRLKQSVFIGVILGALFFFKTGWLSQQKHGTSEHFTRSRTQRTLTNMTLARDSKQTFTNTADALECSRSSRQRADVRDSEQKPRQRGEAPSESPEPWPC